MYVYSKKITHVYLPIRTVCRIVIDLNYVKLLTAAKRIRKLNTKMSAALLETNKNIVRLFVAFYVNRN